MDKCLDLLSHEETGHTQYVASISKFSKLFNYVNLLCTSS